MPEYHEVERKGCALGLIRLQRTYRLPTADVAQGFMAGSQAMALDLADREYIGLLAKEISDYGLYAEWLDEARKLAVTAPDASRILTWLADSYYCVR